MGERTPHEVRMKRLEFKSNLVNLFNGVLGALCILCGVFFAAFPAFTEKHWPWTMNHDSFTAYHLYSGIGLILIGLFALWFGVRWRRG